MGNKEIGKTEFLLKIHEQVDNFGLNRDIKGGNGLVTDDECRVAHQGPSNADALSLSTGKGVRKTSQVLDVQLALACDLPYPFIDFQSTLTEVHRLERLGDNIAHRHARIQRGVRVLKNKLHMTPEAREIATTEVHHVHRVAL